MREQVLDSMELERERGITIKMQPVRMKYHYLGAKLPSNLIEEYELNLIDTPGHIDFYYEVSRSLKAVEGVILLIDATQGVQAQTFTVLNMARELNLMVIPALNKIDLPSARTAEVKEEVIKLLDCDPDSILCVSGKTGAGVEKLLQEVVKRVPSPGSQYESGDNARALVFDFEYSSHQGVIVYIRMLDGSIKKNDGLLFVASGEKFTTLAVGTFSPSKQPTESLLAGEIGYVVTGIKKPGEARVGDTLTKSSHPLPAVAGYLTPRPVVWASIYPASQDDFALFKQALERLKLSDASISFEEEASGTLGRGFRSGFLGMLHLEIITERLRREFNLNLIVATPTISYEILNTRTGERKMIYSPQLFPEENKDYQIFEPWISVKIITPGLYLGHIVQLLHEHEAVIMATETFSGDRTSLDIEMPLRELMRNFFDEIKSVSSGFASFSYQLLDRREADVVRMDVLIGEELVPAFSRIVARQRVEREAQDIAEKLKKLIPQQLIVVKIQVKALGRILAARSISARRKDVTDYLYGGDITRKMKLREKQKKGKKRMQKMGKVSIPPEVFIKMMKSDAD